MLSLYIYLDLQEHAPCVARLQAKFMPCHCLASGWTPSNHLLIYFNRLQQLRPPYPIDQNLVYLDDSPCYIVRNDSLGINGMLGRSCRRDMSDDKCELFTAICDSIGLNPTIVEYYKQVKWRCKFTCAAKLNVRHALRSTMKQGVPCKRMLYCVSSIKRFSWLTPCIVQVVPFYSVWPFKPIVLF